jgi:sulfatase maturation enzyme AslB (radical SAM superfamily)
MSKIIKIVPTEDWFSISWIMHLKCNYDCMYCPTQRHQSANDMLSLDELQRRWITTYDKTKHLNKLYKISFSGGEVTINKNFLPFLNWLTTHYGNKIAQMGVTTNGSASTSYYLNLFNHLNYISFSTHTEHINEKRFFDTAAACAEFARAHPNKSFMVNIMEEFWATDQVKKYTDYCVQNNITYSISKIEYKFKTRDIPIFKND